MSLKNTALSGMVWTFAEQFGNQIINFIVTIFLARILLPEDFGTIAMFTVFVLVAGTITDGGLGSSLIRTKNPDQADFSTVFIFSIAISLLMYVLLFFTAPFISEFYNLPKLTEIIRLYSISIVISPLASIQKIILTKKMDFKTQFKIQLPSLILSGVLGIVLALNGFGVWSLVYSAVFKTLLSTVQYWFYGKWRPSFLFSKEKFLLHFNFGYKMTLSNLINTVFNNIYSLIIGKAFSPALLGYYNRADTLKQLPINNLSSALNRVTFPLFAEISHDNVRLKEVYRKLLKAVIFITAPLLIFMVVSAEPLIRFLLTEKWLPAVPYFQILSIAGILYPIHSYNLNILQVKGRSDLFLKLEIIKKAILLVILYLSFQFGIYGLLWGQVIFSMLAFFINTHFSGQILKYNSLQQFLDLMPSITIAGVVGGFVFFLDQWVFINFIDVFRIIFIFSSYFLFFFCLVCVLKFAEIDFLRGLLKKNKDLE